MEVTPAAEVPKVRLLLRRYLAEVTPHKKQASTEDTRRAHPQEKPLRMSFDIRHHVEEEAAGFS